MSEVRALLLTDVVDSTKLAESIGDAAMAEVWSSHDRVARDLLPKFRGREIDKTDGMLMLFDGAADAVAYALAYHRALADLPVPLKARAGIHVGAVTLRENSAADIALGAKPIEVEGLAKPTAARVMSLARGAQVLLTTEAREDLGKTELKVASHGHWMVKGVADPIELFEVGEEHTRFIPPVDSEKVFRVVQTGEWWLPVRDIPHNLPHQGTSFVGREQELDEVKEFLGKSRLVTLVGMGGLGKTRLCIQAAAELIHQFPDGVWFLDLAPLHDPALVVGEAAQVIGVNEEPGRTRLQAICAHLKTRRALIILDNCEHLVQASAEFAAAVLRSAPNVRMLASSREALHVPGEQLYPVRPLPLPGRDVGLEGLMSSTAVRLFVERARQHKPSFEPDRVQAPILAELVARLDGIPLAIELAAARIKVLSLADINVRLKDRFKLLTGGARVLQERQQTLRALVDWSYDLLSPQEQTLLARLAVFVGGFDLEAAEQICGAEPLSTEEVLDLLASLVEKSLVMFDESGESTRYRMLETIRDYACEKLEQSGDRPARAAAHCDHYFALAKQANYGMRGPEQAEWIRRTEADLDNIRAAISLALSVGTDPFIAVKIAVAMQSFWILRGYASEGRRIIRSALSISAIQESDLAQAWSLYVGAALAESQSDHSEALEMLERCLLLRRRLVHREELAGTLSTISLARLQAGDIDGARGSAREALQIFSEAGDRRGEAIENLHLGQIAAHAGDDSTARSHFEQCLAIAREIGQQECEGAGELNLGILACDEGDIAQSAQHFERSLAVCRDAADKRGEASAVRWLGRLALISGDLLLARERLIEAAMAFRAFEMWEELLDCLEDLATVSALGGALARAIRLSAVATEARDQLRLVRSPRHEEKWTKQIAELRQAAEPATFDAEWAVGAGWAVEDALLAFQADMPRSSALSERSTPSGVFATLQQ